MFELNNIWRYLTIIWRYLTAETFTQEPENYHPKGIVKYRHLSPSGNRTLTLALRRLGFLNSSGDPLDASVFF